MFEVSLSQLIHKTGSCVTVPSVDVPVETALLFVSYFDQFSAVNTGSVGLYVRRFRIQLL